jgi:hypothetical protein
VRWILKHLPTIERSFEAGHCCVWLLVGNETVRSLQEASANNRTYTRESENDQYGSQQQYRNQSNSKPTVEKETYRSTRLNINSFNTVQI